jgi:hypothetical protein
MTLPKFNKDQIQKIALSTIGFVALLYVYFNFFLGPLHTKTAAMTATMLSLESKLGSSKNDLAKAAKLEQQAGSATTRFAALKTLSPEGAPIAWFPPRMKAFFANQAIEKANARLETSGPYKQPELAAWTKYTWNIEIPEADFALLGKAIAQLENSEPLLSTVKLSIRAIPNSPEFQQVNFSATTAILKR